ncbi:MAG: hypothetical protein V4658_03215 [Bacteroidota bacterium]
MKTCLLFGNIKWLALMLCLGVLFACNDDQTSRDAFVELKRVYAPGGAKYILFYQYAAAAEDSNTALILIVQKDEEIDLRNQSYFSNVDLDTIYWLTKDTVVAVEKYLNYLARGKSNYKDSLYPMNTALVKIARVDPVDSTFTREELFKQRSPDKQQELVVFRYVNPQRTYSILNVSILNAENKPGRYGNFYVGKGSFDCIRDIRWDSIGDFAVKASRKCYYGFDEYLVKTRPVLKYKLILSEEIGNTSIKQVDTLTMQSGE